MGNPSKEFMNRLEIDLDDAITAERAANERKCPVKLSRGNARTYAEILDG